MGTKELLNNKLDNWAIPLAELINVVCGAATYSSILDVPCASFHFGVTAYLTAEWTAHQLREVFPWDSAPRYRWRDRDRIFGPEFVEQGKVMGIQQVLSAPRSPWQRAYVERVIGSIRRECLDHVIVFGERSVRRTLTAYFVYYHQWRTHLLLDKDAPDHEGVNGPPRGR